LTKIARVILRPDSSVHIAIQNGETVVCTRKCFVDFLKNPVVFSTTTYMSYRSSTSSLNPQKIPLSQIKGITLIEAYDNNDFKCFYTAIFEIIFSYDRVDANVPIVFGNYISKTDLIDSKDLLLKVFLTIPRIPSIASKVEYELSFDEIGQNEFVNELLQTITQPLLLKNDLKPTGENDVDDTHAPEVSITDYDIAKDNDYISTREWANQHKADRKLVSHQASTGQFQSAVKIKGRWKIHRMDFPLDRREGKKTPPNPKSKSGKNIRLEDESYDAVQKYIKERKLVTDNIREFIRTIQEIRYYTDNNYHEVCWEDKENGERFCGLIIDINPEYVSPVTGKSNRQIILEGGSPVVPGKEPAVYHLHHIGQRSTSPYAVIPSYDHLEKFSVFHQHSSNEELHGKNHEERKHKFWILYLKIYDTYLFYQKIPFLNSKHKKDER